MEWGNIQEKGIYFLKDINQREQVEKQEPLEVHYKSLLFKLLKSMMLYSSVAEQCG